MGRAAPDHYFGVPFRVPASLTSFVGRHADLARARTFLADHRLLTLTGSGGVGKSRLARELCLSAPPETVVDGVWMVELQSVAPSDDVAEAVMVGLGLTSGRGAALQTLLAFVVDRTMVLALDDCDHLLPGCRSLVVTLLRAAPGLRVLATSRESLGIFGEQVVPVGPLSVPASDPVAGPAHDRAVTLVEARRSEAVQLLVARAGTVDPGFSLDVTNVADAVVLVRRLDGVPLAIELAAARLPTLGLQELVRRLDKRFALLNRGDPTGAAHHRTLRAMVQWSYELCTPAEQRLWSDFSVFGGGADLDAVTVVCAGDPEHPAAEPLLDDLHALVSKSVVLAEPTPRGTRFRMLETVAEFGAELLEARGAAGEVRRRHAEYFAALAHDFESGFFSPDQVSWIGRIRAEPRNLGTALRHLVDERVDDGRVALAMATSLRMHWISSAACEGRRWLRAALALDVAPSQARALGLATYAVLAVLADAQAEDRLAEAEQIAAELGSPLLDARIADARAAILVMHGDLPGTLAAGRLAVELGAAAGDPGTQLTGYSSATIAAVLSREPGARQTCLDMAAACVAVGDSWLQAWAYHHLAVEARDRGDLAATEEHADRCLQLAYESANLVALAMTLVPLARVAVARGQFRRAAQLLGGAFELADEVGAGAEPLGTLGASIEVIRRVAGGELGEDRFRRAYEQGRGWPLARLVSTAMTRTELGVPEGAGPAALTTREWDVAQLVAQGKTNRAIAETLYLSPRTVEGHVERILAKRGFRRRTEIATWATQQSDPDRRDA